MNSKGIEQIEKKEMEPVKKLRMNFKVKAPSMIVKVPEMVKMLTMIIPLKIKKKKAIL